MTPRSFLLTPELADYVRAASEAPDQVVADLVAETATLADRGDVPPTFQIAPEQGTFMQLLTRALGVRRAIEIGTFTGLSALHIARGLSGDGSLLCLDRNAEWTAIARRHWERAGLAGRIALRLGDALPSLRELPEEETFDLAFVDADKTGYVDYYEELLPRLRPGGLLLVDNTLWGGAVLDEKDDSPDTLAIRALNDRIAADPRVRVVLLPIGDGLTIAQRL